MTEWITFRLPKELNQELKSFVDTEQAKKIGVINKTQLLIKISRDFLQNPNQISKIKDLQNDAKNNKELLTKMQEQLKRMNNVNIDRVMHGSEFTEKLQLRLQNEIEKTNKLKEDFEIIKEERLDDEAEKIRNDKMAEQNVKQMSQMMDMINDLKSQISSKKNNGKKLKDN